MATYEQDQREAEFLGAEGAGTISREVVTIASGEDIASGAVLGQITLGAITATPDAGNTGDGLIGTVTGDGTQEAGDYTLTIVTADTDAGEFQLVNPDGDMVGFGTVGVAFAGGGLSFTLADGAADFVVGDSIVITVAAGSGKYVELDPTATDGSQAAAAISYSTVDATAADTSATVIVRLAEVYEDKLVWATGVTAGQKTTALAELAQADIIAR